MASAKRVDCATGSSEGFAPLGNLVDVVAHKLVMLLEDGSVCDQAAIAHEFGERVDSRQTRPRSEFRSRKRFVKSMGSPNTRSESEAARVIVANAASRSSARSTPTIVNSKPRSVAAS